MSSLKYIKETFSSKYQLNYIGSASICIVLSNTVDITFSHIFNHLCLIVSRYLILGVVFQTLNSEWNNE